MFTNKFMVKGAVSCEQINEIVDRFDFFNCTEDVEVDSYTEISKAHLEFCAEALTASQRGDEWAHAIHFTFSILKNLVDSRSGTTIDA